MLKQNAWNRKQKFQRQTYFLINQVGSKEETHLILDIRVFMTHTLNSLGLKLLYEHVCLSVTHSVFLF